MTGNGQYIGGGLDDVASYPYTGVLSGSRDEACGEGSAIVAGGTFVNGGSDAPSGGANETDGTDSFIGAGDLNWVMGNAGGSVISGGGYQHANTECCPNTYGNIVGGIDAFIGAGDENQITGSGSFIGAGGFAYPTSSGNLISSTDSFIGAGDKNHISGNDAFIGGGYHDVSSGAGAFIGAGGAAYNSESSGGTGNGNYADGEDSFIGAGDLNDINSSGTGSFIGGGGSANTQAGVLTGNVISGVDSFIGSGDQNTIAGQESFVGGGQSNDITSGAAEAVIAGGVGNVATAQKTSVGGGEGNASEGSFATIPGGYHNLASGNESFAAGSQADATHTGSFVWSDYASGEAALNDGAADEFVVRASGGVYIYSNAKSPYVGVELKAGSGTWSSVSDRNAKTAIVPLDDATVLARVATLPISTWQYKTETGVRHVGPMAQDFFAAFGVGEDDRHITSIDEDGVALAAIKALHRENGELRSALSRVDAERRRKDGEMDRLRATVTNLGARDTVLERRLDALALKVRP